MAERPVDGADAPGAGEALLERFEAAWRKGGAAPAIEAFLPSRGLAATRNLLFLQLVAIDLEFRWRTAPVDTGKLPIKPRLEHYRAAFPHFFGSGPMPANLIAEEYRIRHWYGDRPGRDDYILRFDLDANEAARLFDRVDDELTDDNLSTVTIPAVTIPIPVIGTLTVSDMLETLQRHRFLDTNKLAPIKATQFADAAALLRHLVDRGLLTAMQAEVLLKGRGAELVIGPYLLVDLLGQGWSSHVFRARHTQLNRLVALKVFRKELIAELGPDHGRRFLREMQALGRMAHPNVIHAYDAGPIGATLFLAMELINGVDLASLVSKHGPLPVAHASSYIREAALGLQHAHERGIVHRDLKPSNLLLTRSNPAVVKVLDLGLARLRLTESGRSNSALTRNGDFMGTPDYMAPEQAEDPHLADIRADLYSLGCTLFCLLAGRPPFPGGSFMQKVNRHRDEKPPRLETLRKDVLPALVEVVSRLLAKRPEQRFQTPAELAAALAPLVSGVQALPQRIDLRSPKSGRRSLLWASCGVVAAAAAGGLAWWQWTRSRTPPGDEPIPLSSISKPKKTGVPVLEFNGSQFVVLPDELIWASKAVTFEAWFRTGQGGVILGYQANPWPSSGDNHVPALYIGTDGLLRGCFWTGAAIVIASKQPVLDQRWHHVALVTDGNTQTLFLDGDQIGRTEGNINNLHMIHNQLGAGSTAFWPADADRLNYFKGRLCELRFWHIARTQDEIRKQMSQPLTGTEAGLAAYYPVEMSQSDSLPDRSTHKRHAALGSRRSPNRPPTVMDFNFPGGR